MEDFYVGFLLDLYRQRVSCQSWRSKISLDYDLKKQKCTDAVCSFMFPLALLCFISDLYNACCVITNQTSAHSCTREA